MIHAVDVSAVAFAQRCASLSRPSRGVLVVALADRALLALQALVDDVVASDCGLVRGAGSSLPVIHDVDVSAVAFDQRRASFLLPSRGVLVAALADRALLALQALVDDVVASDCGVVRCAGSSLPATDSADVSVVACEQTRAYFLHWLLAPSTTACASSALSLVLWEKLFEGCLAGGHFFAGTVQYCSFLRAIFESNDSKKRYSGHTGIMITKYFYTLKKES